MVMSELTNQDIFAYALYRLQGAGQFVDVEEVWVECWRLSPSRFGWRSRRDEFPSDRVALKAQGDLERAHPELITKTLNGLCRQLTAEGVAWVRERIVDFERLAAGETKAPATRRVSYRVIAELARNPNVQRALAGGQARFNKVELADLLGCAPDSPASIWQERLTTLRSAAEDSERRDLVRFIDGVRLNHEDWFKGR